MLDPAYPPQECFARWNTRATLTDPTTITLDRAEYEALVEALEFYADKSGWNQPPVKTRDSLISVEYENQASKIQRDRGRIAVAALKAVQS